MMSIRSPKLLDQVRARLRTQHLSLRTEEAYVGGIRHFILFHGKRHSNFMGAAEIEAFLSHLAIAGKVPASTQNQALAALLYLYRKVLEVKFPWLDGITRAKERERLPVVPMPTEVLKVLSGIEPSLNEK